MQVKRYFQGTENEERLGRDLRKNDGTVIRPVVDPDPRVVVGLWVNSGGRCHGDNTFDI